MSWGFWGRSGSSFCLSLLGTSYNTILEVQSENTNPSDPTTPNPVSSRGVFALAFTRPRVSYDLTDR